MEPVAQKGVLDLLPLNRSPSSAHNSTRWDTHELALLLRCWGSPIIFLPYQRMSFVGPWWELPVIPIEPRSCFGTNLGNPVLRMAECPCESMHCQLWVACHDLLGVQKRLETLFPMHPGWQRLRTYVPQFRDSIAGCRVPLPITRWLEGSLQPCFCRGQPIQSVALSPPAVGSINRHW